MYRTTEGVKKLNRRNPFTNDYVENAEMLR